MSGTVALAQDDFKTYSAEGVTLEYPADWFLCMANSYSVTFTNLERDECEMDRDLESGLVIVEVSYGSNPNQSFAYADESPEFRMPLAAGSVATVYLYQFVFGGEDIDDISGSFGALESIAIGDQEGLMIRFDMAGVEKSVEWVNIRLEDDYSINAATPKGELDQYLDDILKLATSIQLG